MGGEEQVEWKRRGRGRDGALEGPPISSLVLAQGPRRVNPALDSSGTLNPTIPYKGAQLLMGGEEQVEWKRRGRGRDGALEPPPFRHSCWHWAPEGLIQHWSSGTLNPTIPYPVLYNFI